jgi:hypothetical protein
MHIFNHAVSEAVGEVHNHAMGDGAPEMSQVINHSMNDCASAEDLAKVLGLYRYPGRALGGSNPGDVICLTSDIQSQWDPIVEHYSDIGLPHADKVIWSDSLDSIGQYPALSPSVFFFGQSAHAARPDQEWFDIVKLMNNKNTFIDLAEALNLRTPLTARYNSVDQYETSQEQVFPCYLKVAESVSGLGVLRCNDRLELEEAVSRIPQNVSFQVQEDLGRETMFLNVQYRVVGDDLERFAVTKQLLDGNTHVGNTFPAISEPWLVTDKLALYMHEKGMKGYFAFDVAVVNGEYYLLECNPRYNGASYPSNIAEKLHMESWTSVMISTSCQCLSERDFGGLSYSAKRREGVVIVNWGCVLDGKLVILVAGNQSKHQRMIDEFANLFA